MAQLAAAFEELKQVFPAVAARAARSQQGERGYDELFKVEFEHDTKATLRPTDTPSVTVRAQFNVSNPPQLRVQYQVNGNLDISAEDLAILVPTTTTENGWQVADEKGIPHEALVDRILGRMLEMASKAV